MAFESDLLEKHFCHQTETVFPYYSAIGVNYSWVVFYAKKSCSLLNNQIE